MKCAGCGNDSPPGARFCAGCGARLVPGARRAGTELPAGAPFLSPSAGMRRRRPPGARAEYAKPGGATRPSTSPRRSSPRRRPRGRAQAGHRAVRRRLGLHVALSERLDPEDVHGLMTRVFELILAEVHRYEGTVNQFLGDGVMALFGAPIAHEDHARRGVQAALGIAKALGAYRRRAARAHEASPSGSGRASTRAWWSSAASATTCAWTTRRWGTRPTSPRGCNRRPSPDTSLISEATHRLVVGLLRDAGPRRAVAQGKGRAGPRLGRRVGPGRRGRGSRSRPTGASRPSSGASASSGSSRRPSSGRRAGRGQVVFVVGEPGIGKSRLLYEFRRRVADRATWLEGHCLSFGQAIAVPPR